MSCAGSRTKQNHAVDNAWKSLPEPEQLRCPPQKDGRQIYNNFCGWDAFSFFYSLRRLSRSHKSGWFCDSERRLSRRFHLGWTEWTCHTGWPVVLRAPTMYKQKLQSPSKKKLIVTSVYVRGRLRAIQASTPVHLAPGLGAAPPFGDVGAMRLPEMYLRDSCVLLDCNNWMFSLSFSFLPFFFFPNLLPLVYASIFKLFRQLTSCCTAAQPLSILVQAPARTLWSPRPVGKKRKKLKVFEEKKRSIARHVHWIMMHQVLNDRTACIITTTSATHSTLNYLWRKVGNNGSRHDFFQNLIEKYISFQKVRYDECF